MSTLNVCIKYIKLNKHILQFYNQPTNLQKKLLLIKTVVGQLRLGYLIYTYSKT